MVRICPQLLSLYSVPHTVIIDRCFSPPSWVLLSSGCRILIPTLDNFDLSWDFASLNYPRVEIFRKSPLLSQLGVCSESIHFQSFAALFFWGVGRNMPPTDAVNLQIIAGLLEEGHKLLKEG